MFDVFRKRIILVLTKISIYLFVNTVRFEEPQDTDRRTSIGNEKRYNNFLNITLNTYTINLRIIFAVLLKKNIFNYILSDVYKRANITIYINITLLNK